MIFLRATKSVFSVRFIIAGGNIDPDLVPTQVVCSLVSKRQFQEAKKCHSCKIKANLVAVSNDCHHDLHSLNLNLSRFFSVFAVYI